MIIGFKFYGSCATTETNAILPTTKERFEAENIEIPFNQLVVTNLN